MQWPNIGYEIPMIERYTIPDDCVDVKKHHENMTGRETEKVRNNTSHKKRRGMMTHSEWEEQREDHLKVTCIAKIL